MADNQFESIQGDLADIGSLLNIVSTDEHVPEIEWDNRTIKESVKCIYNTLPFKYLPPVSFIEIVHACVFWHNMFALCGSISELKAHWRLFSTKLLTSMHNAQLNLGTANKHTKNMITAWQHLPLVPLPCNPLGTCKGATSLLPLTKAIELTDMITYA